MHAPGIGGLLSLPSQNLPDIDDCLSSHTSHLVQGLEIPKGVRTPEIGGVLEAVMGKLEKDRATLQVRKLVQVSRLRSAEGLIDGQAGEGRGSRCGSVVCAVLEGWLMGLLS